MSQFRSAPPTCFDILPHKISDHGDLTEIAEQENAEMQEHLLGIAEEALHTTKEEGGGDDGAGEEETTEQDMALNDCARQTAVDLVQVDYSKGAA